MTQPTPPNPPPRPLLLSGMVLLLAAVIAFLVVRRPPPPAAEPAAAEPQTAPVPAPLSPPPPTLVNEPVPAANLPSVRNPTPPETTAPPPAEPGFRLSAMIGGGDSRDAVGIVDRATGQDYQLVRLLGSTPDGWTLIRMDFDRETATFEKNGQTHVASLEQGETIRSVPPPPPDRRPPSRPPAAPESMPTPPPPLADPPDPAAPFSNVTFQADGQHVAVSRVEQSPDVVEVRTAGERYAIRRNVAESVLRIGSITPEDRLYMLMSFPGLVSVQAGENPAEMTAEAEAQLQEILSDPPTNRPDVEELNRLLDQYGFPANEP